MLSSARRCESQRPSGSEHLPGIARRGAIRRQLAVWPRDLPVSPAPDLVDNSQWFSRRLIPRLPAKQIATGFYTRVQCSWKMASSVRTRSASPKSVSFSPILERKYNSNRAGPSNPPELDSNNWRRYFTDFSAYLGEWLALCENKMPRFIDVTGLALYWFWCQWGGRLYENRLTNKLRNRTLTISFMGCSN